MQALSMIDMGAKTPETVAPAKPAEPHGKQFGKVLGAQQRPEKQQKAAEPKAKQQPAAKEAIAKSVTAEEHPVQQQETDKVVAEEKVPAQGEAMVKAEPKLQHTIVNLLTVIAAGETIETGEESGSMGELLTQLVEQLDSSELKGEQLLAGIDLSALVEQLPAEDIEEQLAQLVAQLEERLAAEEGLLANTELTAATLSTTEQPAVAPVLVENLAQARQVLQRAIDSVAAQKTTPVVAEEGVASKEVLLGQEAAEKIDPRFAGLLKPRSEQQLQPSPSLRQQVQGNSAKPNAGDAAQLITAVAPEQTETAEAAELLRSAPKQGLENLLQQAQAQPTAAPQTQNGAGKALPTTPMVQLPSGQQVAESQIFDQVVTRFSGSFNGESGRMVLRLQPAELGSLRLELIVEGDRIRANIQAQSQQVQEVLERNLPQLRSALAEQGLKIDQFRVDVNQEQSQQNQFDQLAQQQQQQQKQNSSAQPRWQQDMAAEEQVIPLAHLMQNGGGGISLHV